MASVSSVIQLSEIAFRPQTGRDTHSHSTKYSAARPLLTDRDSRRRIEYTGRGLNDPPGENRNMGSLLPILIVNASCVWNIVPVISFRNASV